MRVTGEVFTLQVGATYIGFEKNSTPRKVVKMDETWVEYVQRKTRDNPTVDESQTRTTLLLSFEKWVRAQVLI